LDDAEAMSSRYPHWPRMMTRRTASAYCDLTSAGFEREVMAGRLPVPVMLDGEEHWSQVEIDAALDRLLGVKVKGYWRKEQPGLAA
jgi:hypothetical protein